MNACKRMDVSGPGMSQHGARMRSRESRGRDGLNQLNGPVLCDAPDPGHALALHGAAKGPEV